MAMFTEDDIRTRLISVADRRNEMIMPVVLADLSESSNSPYDSAPSTALVGGRSWRRWGAVESCAAEDHAHLPERNREVNWGERISRKTRQGVVSNHRQRVPR